MFSADAEFQVGSHQPGTGFPLAFAEEACGELPCELQEEFQESRMAVYSVLGRFQFTVSVFLVRFLRTVK